MAHGERCLLVHGHFYQPPRENPWTGQIDPQPSAAPWENWNNRIADECYLPMARSRVYGKNHDIVDLYNNYAHTSFNFGPTLLSWMHQVHPECIRHLRDATVLDRTFAMAQAYNHMMLPLADARDRHTQILWGLREFHHRFGFYPEGMWLSECGIDAETVRALIDHKIRYVILSPHQASRARPFGSADWQDVSMGSVDTRRAYRLFDTDGGGRTHFERHLDIVFYTPGLNLKVSFDHILNRPDDLARELESCYLPGYDGAQLVSIVTDGEIYGHHEKQGDEALARLYRDIAPSLGLKVVSGLEFIRDNPPVWEVKLWQGEDGNGSSWSCDHGMGRWSRDCGCRPPTGPGWNQRWRAPLRHAFDAVRDRVRFVTRRELGGLLRDADEAVDAYIRVVVDPSVASRRRFVDDHAQRPLTLEETERLWRMLEARHNAMLMYSSCGWFFDELSGLEPVQNMRYALRACELVAPYHDEDVAAILEEQLSRAKSNIEHWVDGGRVFRKLVLPSRHSNRELAAAMAVCLAGGFPLTGLSWKIVDMTETVHYRDTAGLDVSWGSFVCHDERLDRFIKTSWVVRLDGMDNSGVGLNGYEEVQGDVYRSARECPLVPNADFDWLREIRERLQSMRYDEVFEALSEFTLSFDRLPELVRQMLYRRFSGADEEMLLHEAAGLGTRAVPFLVRARRYGQQVPDTVLRAVTGAGEKQILDVTLGAVSTMRFDEAAAGEIVNQISASRELGLSPSLDACWRALYISAFETVRWMAGISESGWLAARVALALPDGGEWLAPASQVEHGMRYPFAGGLALALGQGMAGMRRRLEGLGAAEALLALPLLEILEFMGKVGLDARGAAAVARQYWDFLDLPLSRLMREDPERLAVGDVGKRLRRTGMVLGFDTDILEERIRSAARASVQ